MLFAERRKAGIAALQDGDTAAASELLEACLAEHPDDGQTLLYLGVCRGLRNDLAGAETLLEQARGLLPDDPRVHFNLARLHHRAGHTDRAAAGYRETLRLDPHHAKARESLQSLGEPTETPSSRPPWEQPPATVTAAVAEPPTAWRGTSLPNDDVVCRACDPLSVVKNGAVIGIGVGLLYAVVLIGVTQFSPSLRSSAGEFAGPAMLLVALLLVPFCALAVAIANGLCGVCYNLSAKWLGGVLLELSADAGDLGILRIDAISAARALTVVNGILQIAYLAVSLVAQMAMMAIAGAAGGPGGAVQFVVMAVAMVLGTIVGLAVNFVVYLIIALVYNWSAPFYGGLRLVAEQDGSWTTIRAVTFRSLVTTLFFTSLPWLVLFGVIAVPVAALTGGAGPAGGVIAAFLIGVPLVLVVVAALQAGLFNAAGAIGCGPRLQLEEE